MTILVLAALAAPAPDEKTADKEVNVIARGEIQLSPDAFPKGIQEAVGDGEALAKLLQMDGAEKARARAADALHVKGIDFDKQTLLVVSCGPIRGLLRQDVTGLSVEKGQLTVRWAVTTTLIVEPPVHVARLVLVDKFNGKVVFAPPEESAR